ncbi:MAG: MFS transporter [Gammaproteobacteria bacterium]|nr:MFS transporter [Gammaproteobacteria bacterium]MDP6732806.1 MFS transporter [Gammaproteobacteria bacterium]
MLKNSKLHRNITVIYGLAFFHCFMVIVPVIVPFFMSKGLSLAEIFYLQAVFATTIVLLEAPSGYFADLFGRRFALIIGSVIHGFGYFLLNFANDMASLMVFEIIAGVAMSLLSGADIALLYDTQKALDEDVQTESAKGIAQLGFMKSLAEALGALVGGVLALWSFDLMVLIQSAVAWVCLLLALLVVEPPYKKAGAVGSRLQITEILKHLLIRDPVLRRVVLAIPFYSLATFHVAWLMQPYWESQGLSLAVFGILWCAQSLTVALANKFGFNLERRFGASTVLVLIGALPILGHFGMAWFQGWTGIVIGLLLFVCRGLNQVILVNALNRRVPSEFRATANSFTSFLFRLAFITTGPLVGYVAETQGLVTALNLLGISSIALFVVVMIPLIQSVKAIQRHVVA